MAGCKLAKGSILTDEDIERICEEFENESWTGALERGRKGPVSAEKGSLSDTEWE